MYSKFVHHLTSFKRIRFFALACLIGSFETFMLQSTIAAGVNSRISQSAELLGDEVLVNELNRMEVQINQRAKKVSLNEAISTGIRSNPQLFQAFSVIQQYEWQLIASQRQWYPTFQLSNGSPFAGIQWSSFVQNYQRKSTSSPGNVSRNSKFNELQPGASINWNAIDLTRQPNINAANESLRQQKLLFDVSARNLILDIQQSYFSIQSSQQLIDSFRSIYEINRNHLIILQTQRKIGMVTVLDVQATRSQLFSLLNQLVVYTRNYIDQSAALAEALALPEGSLAIPSDSAEPRGDWKINLDQTIELAKIQREEIMANLAAAESAKWTGVAGLRSYLPVFQLVATGNLSLNKGTESFADRDRNIQIPTSSQTSNGALGLGFTWSLFDGGIQSANAQAAFAQSRQQRDQAAITQLQVMRQVRTSYNQLETSRVSIKSAQIAYQAAKIAEQAAWARYSVGIGDITSVVQSFSLLSTASQQLSEATLSYNTGVAQLHRYAAIWPQNTQQEVKQQLQQLRQTNYYTQMNFQP